MIDLIFSGLKQAYGVYKGVMQHKAEFGVFEEQAEDAEERIECVMPAVLRLEGSLEDDLTPSLSVMKKVIDKMIKVRRLRRAPRVQTPRGICLLPGHALARWRRLIGSASRGTRVSLALARDARALLR